MAAFGRHNYKGGAAAFGRRPPFVVSDCAGAGTDTVAGVAAWFSAWVAPGFAAGVAAWFSAWVAPDAAAGVAAVVAAGAAWYAWYAGRRNIGSEKL